MRKPDFCLGENKGADQLRGNRDSLAQNQFDLELWYKVFFFTDSCRLDIAIKDSG